MPGTRRILASVEKLARASWRLGRPSPSAQARGIERWDDDLSLEVASRFSGSASIEEHLWNSGWQTATVQLLTNLTPGECIIDVGCGVGRLAYGLYGWFPGRYVGVDIGLPAIDYCRKRFPRYEFHHLDVSSPTFNPAGKQEPRDLVLPMADGSVDVAVLFSVYTHLLPDTLVRMTSEVSRVLKSGGRCLATFFVLGEMSEHARYSFGHELAPSCRVERPEEPEAAVAYRKDFLLETFASFDLRLEAFYGGAWTGRYGGLGLQDHALFRR